MCRSIFTFSCVCDGDNGFRSGYSVGGPYLLISYPPVSISAKSICSHSDCSHEDTATRDVEASGLRHTRCIVAHRRSRRCHSHLMTPSREITTPNTMEAPSEMREFFIGENPASANVFDCLFIREFHRRPRPSVAGMVGRRRISRS